jgi:hypothetical protein
MTSSITLYNAQSLVSVSFTGPGTVSGVDDGEAADLVAAGYASYTPGGES